MSEILSNMYIGLWVKYLLFLSDRNETRVFLTYLRKIFKYQNSTKIRPVGTEMFHAEGHMDGQRDGQTGRRTEITKLIFAFHYFSNASKNRRILYFKDLRVLREKLKILIEE